MSTIPTLEEVCERALKLPCSPSLLPRLIQVLEDVNSSSDNIEGIIKMDTALAGATLRLANSAFFGTGGSKVDSLTEAVMRLGSKEIYRLAALSMAGRWMTQKVQGYQWEPGDFCRRSLVTAIAAECLAGQDDLVNPSVAYTAGLLHEIGKLAIAYSCAAQMPEVLQLCKAESLSWNVAELRLLGYNYPMVGSHMLKRWNFPQSLVAVAELQPPTVGMPEAVMPLALVVHAGKYLATCLGPGAAEDGFLFEFNSDLLVARGYTPERMESALPEILKRATKMLGDKLTKGEITF